MNEEKNQFQDSKELKRHLGTYSVFAISSGAAFSSGFFLLPGMAAEMSGPSMPLAYLAAGLLMLPGIFTIAELSSAMPRAGGPYFFITRSFGPLPGLIGVSGMYVMLLLKGAFAFVGVGIYLSLLVDVPLQSVAIALIVVFTIINLLDVKQTAVIEIGLVVVLLAILSYFLVSGTYDVFQAEINLTERFTPLFPFGWEAFLATIAFVFISFGGVGQVASIAAEVKQPSKSIPRGMLASLLVATFFYLVGTGLMVALIPPDMFQGNQTPAATATEQLITLPLPLLLIVVAAIAAFASTGNAAILSASRYPMALARDRLLWKRFSVLSKNGIPKNAVIVSGILSIALVVLLDVEEIAKIASGFLLFVFFSLCLAVIVFRESKKADYKPKYKTPFYPWTQIAGIIFYLFLIRESGLEVILLIAAVIVVGSLWYFFVIKEKPSMSAAIYFLFGRLAGEGAKGTHPQTNILSDTDLTSVSEQAFFKDMESEAHIDVVIEEVADELENIIGGEKEAIVTYIHEKIHQQGQPIKAGILVAPLLFNEIEQPEMMITRGRIKLNNDMINGFIVLADDNSRSDRHLQLLSQLEHALKDPDFKKKWHKAETAEDIKKLFIQDVRTLSVRITDSGKTAQLEGKKLKEIDLPDHVLAAVVYREGKMTIPNAETVLKPGDEVTFISDGKAMQALMDELKE